MLYVEEITQKICTFDVRIISVMSTYAEITINKLCIYQHCGYHGSVFSNGGCDDTERI